MTARWVTFRHCQACADCGGMVRNRDYFDPDNRQNVDGIPPCTCRSRRPAPVARDH